MNEENNFNIENEPAEVQGETVQFSLDKTKHIDLAKADNTAENSAAEQEQELLINQAPPTEFEDIFSDEGLKEDTSSVAEGVVAIEEVFRQNAQMINKDFHNETGEIPDIENEASSPKLKKAALIASIVSGSIILLAVIIALIILL